MKKLMIVAAVAALSTGAFASCGETITGCKTVFTVKFSGKTAVENQAGTYTTVTKISGKGSLTFSADDYAEELAIKVGKQKYDLFLTGGELTKWSYFGKNLETLEGGDYKPGKTYKLESDLGIKFAEAYLDEDQSEEVSGFNVYQVAFGQVKVYITKDKKASGCGEDVTGCIPVVTPVKYSGWFTGDFEPTCLDLADYDDDCVVFEDNTIALFGGTWSAKYNKKASR